MSYDLNEPGINKTEADRIEKHKILSSLFYSGCFVLLLWIIQFIQWTLEKDLSSFGVLPRQLSGLKGILTAPLVHADISHLFSNSTTLFLLLFGILYFYRSSAVKVFFIIYFFDGFLVWLFGRESYHIGASGLVYGFAGFLFFSGLFRKDKRSIALSLLIVFLYGGMVWGVLPTDPKISFESHLFGALTGIVCAFIFRKNDPPPKYEWEEEDDDNNNNGYYKEYDDGKKPEETLSLYEDDSNDSNNDNDNDNDSSDNDYDDAEPNDFRRN